MKKKIFLFLFFYSFQIQAQERLSTTRGIIHFDASVPLYEEVKAINQAVDCSFELKTNEINCTILIKQFQFKREMMRTHFNNYYLESDQYPRASFIGTIEKFDYKLLSEEPTEYQINGVIKIHGKSKPLICKSSVRKTTKGMEINTSFALNTDDFNIAIPFIVAPKISKKVQTTLKLVVLE